VNDTLPDEPLMGPIRLVDWQRLLRLLSIARCELADHPKGVRYERLEERDSAIFLTLRPPVPAVAPDRTVYNSPDRTKNGRGAVMLQAVRLSAQGLDIVVHSRGDHSAAHGTGSWSVGINDITAIEQAL
jgi:hypothetical protein